MNITVIATGTELLRGTTVNTNLAAIGRLLLPLGLTVTRSIEVGDDRGELHRALETAVALGSEAVIVTGGLGPTTDDLSREAVAGFLHRRLAPDAALVTALKQYWSRRHRDWEPPEGFWHQADVPEGARVLANPNGSAPGLYLTSRLHDREVHFFLLPGPPSELIPMAEHELAPLLARLRTGEALRKVEAMLIAGTPELKVQLAAERLTADLALELAYCANAEGTRLFLAGSDESALAEARRRVREEFGHAIPDTPVLSLVPDVIHLLQISHHTLALAESCTGGLLASELTDYPGVSEFFPGGIVSYSNEVKHRQLGVPEEIFVRHGAVSAECANAMAEGACRTFGADCAIAVTGIAGPGGGTPEKPVGLVYIAARTPSETAVRRFQFHGDRQSIRQRTAANGWILLRELLIKELYQ